jgi:hypothetical protein
MVAHVGGAPVEELLLAATGLGTAALLAVRAWLSAHLRLREEDPAGS